VRDDSFREFEDSNKLVSDLVWAIENKPEKWKGPFFDRLVEATSSKKSASLTSIVSGRGSRKSISLALKKLHELGYIKHLPPLENIWCLKDPLFQEHYRKAFSRGIQVGGELGSSERLKGKVLELILDKVNSRVIRQSDIEVIDQSGEQLSKLTLWSYSEDDPAVFRKVQEKLQQGVNKGKWKNIKISLHYTGPKHPDINEGRIVLLRGQDPRPITLIEEIDWINYKFGGQNAPSTCGGLMSDLFSPLVP